MENNSTICDTDLAVQIFIESANKLWINDMKNGFKKVTESDAIRFLTARNFDVARAVALYSQHEIIRREEDLFDFDLKSEPLLSELNSKKFTIVPNYDNNDPTLAVFTASLHNPQIISHKITLQALIFQLDASLRNPVTQKNGLIFIYDMTNSKYSNFDYELSHKILTLLKGAYPAKLKKVFIVSAPFWFRASLKVLSLFVRDKIRERILTVSTDQLIDHISASKLPKELGGLLEYDHSKWISFCYASMNNDRLVDFTQFVCDSNSLPDSLHAERRLLMTKKSNEDNMGVPANVSNRDNVQNISQQSQQQEQQEQQSPQQQSQQQQQQQPQQQQQEVQPIIAVIDIDRFYECSIDNRLFTCDEFLEYFQNTNKQIFVSEYNEIRTKPPEGTFNISSLKKNRTKNRYSDVLCYDHSRVVLQKKSSDDGDYIHANFVHGYRQRNAYILTQGPMANTIEDFWRMIWEQRCLIIVMLTKLVERARMKCHKYWDSEAGGDVQCGSFQILTHHVNVYKEYTQTTFKLVNLKTKESRILSHWQFTAWPDYGVPQSPASLLEFIRNVREDSVILLEKLGKSWTGEIHGPPVVVHCSAGIGRTGTYCTLDVCMLKLLDIGKISIKSIVEKIRSQRAHAIQMSDQYIFCHLAIIQFAISLGFLPSTDLSTYYRYLDN